MNLSQAFRGAVTAQGMLVALWMSPPENAVAAKVKANSSQHEQKPTPEKLQSVVRELIEQPGGSCHNSDRQTAKPAALKVFDLQEDDWTARMSNDQLKKVIGRANGTDLPPAK